jgi:hypothetical protein
MKKTITVRSIAIIAVILVLAVVLTILFVNYYSGEEAAPSEQPSTQDTKTDEEKTLHSDELETLAAEFVNHIRGGEYEAAFNMFDQEFAFEAGITKEALQEGWEALTYPLGSFLREGEYNRKFGGGYFIFTIPADFENGGTLTVVRIDATGKIADAQFSNGPFIVPVNVGDLPNGVVENNILVGKDSDYPLNGKLTYPDSALSGKGLPLFVLIPPIYRHDMDYTTEYGFLYKTLAYDLAKAGFASLRYDNWSFSYPMELDATAAKDFTSEREVVMDAISARAAAIEGKPGGMSFTGIYALGHNYSGMLIPRIVEEGLYDGGVVLSATPDHIIDVLYEKYKTYGDGEEYLEAIKEEYDRAYGRAMIPDESRQIDLRYKGLDNLSEEELHIVNYFSFPAYYLKYFNPKPTSEYFATLSKPLLILTVGKDPDMPNSISYYAYDALIKDTKAEKMATLEYFADLNGYFSTNEISADPKTVPTMSLDKRLIKAIEPWLQSMPLG